MLLDREEYVEQAYFFRTLRERMQQNDVHPGPAGGDPPGDPGHDQAADGPGLHGRRAAA